MSALAPALVVATAVLLALIGVRWGVDSRPGPGDASGQWPFHPYRH